LEEKALKELHLDQVGKERFARFQDIECEKWFMEIVAVYKKGLMDAINLTRVIETVEMNEELVEDAISDEFLDRLALRATNDTRILKDPEYQRIHAAMKDQEAIFRPQLDGKAMKAYLEWDALWGEMSCLEKKFAYETGYVDGFGQAKGLPLEDMEEDASPQEAASSSK
jgi:hypothetical protein